MDWQFIIKFLTPVCSTNSGITFGPWQKLRVKPIPKCYWGPRDTEDTVYAVAPTARWNGRTVQLYHRRKSFEGDGQTSERLGSTPYTVLTGLSVSCPWQDGLDTGAHSFRKRTSSALWHSVRFTEWRIKGGDRVRRWLEGESAGRSRNGAPQNSGGDWQNENTLRP